MKYVTKKRNRKKKKKEENEFIVPKPEIFKENLSNKYIGIKNQGLTCHLKVTLQALFSIKEIVDLVYESADNFPKFSKLLQIQRNIPADLSLRFH